MYKNNKSVRERFYNVHSKAILYDGLPDIQRPVEKMSYFELFPSSVIYAIPVLYFLGLVVYYRSYKIPFYVNPSFHLAGLVGEQKSDVFQCAGSFAHSFIAPYVTFHNTAEHSVASMIERIEQQGMVYPMVAKPEIGCRGAGVKLLFNEKEFRDFIASFPKNHSFLLQKRIVYEAEAGVFYMRHPNEKRGKIFSMGFKYQSYLVGNGKDTLKQLIKKHPRARHVSGTYFKRHEQYLNTIIPDGKIFRLGFACSHKHGAIFSDASHYITPQLEEKICQIAEDIKDFHYGRFDIRFKNIEDFQAGKNFHIIEINGISSESTHIWDSSSSFWNIQKTLCAQFRNLFRIGAANRACFSLKPTIKTLLTSFLKEKKLVKLYPITD